MVNRGLARRTILTNDGDRRFFLSLVARGVRKGRIRVHAYSLMTNHYHLLVTSAGCLSVFMQWAMSLFVRRINRRRDRDGPMFRGRFRARRVCGEADFRNVVRYIDQNPVAAGMVSEPEAYRFGSARHYAHSSPRPRWLYRDEVVRVGAAAPGTAAVRRGGGAALSWWAERRLEVGVEEPDAFSRLVDAGSTDAVVAWLRQDAVDGRGGQRTPLVDPATILRHVELIPHSLAALRQSGDGRCRDPLALMRSGLLRAASGLSIAEIARLLRVPPDTVRSRNDRHRTLVAVDPLYVKSAGQVVAGALREIAYQIGV